MGWCSATLIFDAVAEGLLEKEPKRTPKEILKFLFQTLGDMDWDCQEDSKYWNHPIIQEIVKELNSEDSE